MGCHPSHWRTPSFFKMVKNHQADFQCVSRLFKCTSHCTLIEPGWTDVVNVSGWCESEKRRNEANKTWRFDDFMTIGGHLAKTSYGSSSLIFGSFKRNVNWSEFHSPSPRCGSNLDLIGTWWRHFLDGDSVKISWCNWKKTSLSLGNIEPWKNPYLLNLSCPYLLNLSCPHLLKLSCFY